MRILRRFPIFACLFLSIALTACVSRSPNANGFDQISNLQSKQIDRVPAAAAYKVMFIHGMFMTPISWEKWEQRFQAAGYEVSAPAWPLHDGSVTDLRNPEKMAALGKLQLQEVLDYYRGILKNEPVKPILIGHSMGGLIAQILLTEGLGSAAIAIDSAPPEGVSVVSLSFIRANSGVLNFFANADSPLQLSLGDFAYAFAPVQTPDQQKFLYDTYYVPESRHIGRAPLGDVAKIDPTVARGPLLLIAGEKDNIIPSKLNYKNFGFYEKTPGVTEFKEFKGRDHSTVLSPDWEPVADYVIDWIGKIPTK